MQEDAMQEDAMQEDAMGGLQNRMPRGRQEDARRTPGGLREDSAGGLQKDAGRGRREDTKRRQAGSQKRSPEGLLREYLLSPGGGASLDVCERYPRAGPELSQPARGQCP